MTNEQRKVPVVNQIVTVQGSAGEVRTGRVIWVDKQLETFELSAYGRTFTYLFRDIIEG